MNEKLKGDARPFLTVIKKASVNFLLVSASAGAAGVGALYAGLCGAVLGLAHGGWWAAAFGCGQRGALAGLAAGALTAVFGGLSFARLMSGSRTLLPTLPPKERRHVDFSVRGGRATDRPFVPTRALSGMDH
jgi:hypothetical protein